MRHVARIPDTIDKAVICRPGEEDTHPFRGDIIHDAIAEGRLEIIRITGELIVVGPVSNGAARAVPLREVFDPIPVNLKKLSIRTRGMVNGVVLG